MNGRSIKAGLLCISLMILGGSMNACAMGGNGNTLELALDKLRELFLGATVPEGRESYYTNLYQLTNWLTARSSSRTTPALKLDALTPCNTWRQAA